MLKNKEDISIIEKENYIGGRIKSVRSDSSVFEIGSQFFCKSDVNIWKLVKRKKLEKDLVKLDFSNISFFYKNKIDDDVDNAVNDISNIIDTYEKEKKIKYFDDWFFNNIGKEKIYIPQSIIRAITFSDSSKTLTGYGVYILQTFFDDCFTFKNGLDEIIHSLSKNSDIDNRTVQKLIFKKNRLIALDTDCGIIDTTNDTVISSAPPPDIKIKNHDILLKNFNNIRYSGCAVIIFRIKKGFPEKSDYIFFPEKKMKISVIEQMNINDNDFIGCLIPHTSKIGKNEVVSYSKKFLGKILSCNFEEKIMDTYYADWPNGLPLVNENYVKAVDTINKMKFSNLFFVGDYTTHFPSMDSAVRSGFDVQLKLKNI